MGLLGQSAAPEPLAQGIPDTLGQKENPDGKGWATGAGYGEKILTILKGILGTAGGAAPSAPAETEIWYRVRKTWADASSQKGALAKFGTVVESCS